MNLAAKMLTALKNNKATQPVSNSKGFSLGEIVIVLVIIGSIMAIVLPKITEGNSKSKQNTTRMKMAEIENKINEYNSECGKLPTSLSFITEDDPQCKNWTGNSKMKHLLKDAWNTDFEYEASEGGYNLKSLGADKKAGGKEFDRDFMSEGSQAGEE